MNKRKQIITKFLLAIFMVFTISFNFINVSEAGNLYGLDFNVDIQENGDARINMVWDSLEDEGTEIYIPIENLKDMEVKDLVVLENGQQFENIEDWDSDLSREEKVNKSGIIKTDDGYELCWGIGYGEDHIYTVSYTVTNMVKQLNDSQMIYWQFVNPGMNNSPERMNLRIKSQMPFTEDNTRFWSFGFTGNGYFNDGLIDIMSTQSLTDNEKVTVLMKFEQGMFNASSKIDENFDYYKEMAFEGSSFTMETAEEAQAREAKESSIIKVIIAIIAAAIGGIIFIIVGMSKVSQKPFIDTKKYKEKYYRDIPYKGHIEDIYYLLENINMASYDKFINYYFLKWIKEGVISYTTEKKGIFKSEKSNIIIIKGINKSGYMEQRFFDILSSMSTVKNEEGQKILTDKDMKKWMKKESNNDKFIKWTEDLSSKSMETCIEKGYIEGSVNKYMIFKKYVQIGTKEGIEIQENLVCFKNYLKDFSLLNERQAYEVEIWDEYMMYAAIFGITKEVEKQFEKISPEYFDATIYDSNTLLILYLYSGNMRTYSSESSMASASAGLGGSSSIGGGGGSFGGGMGGGAR